MEGQLKLNIFRVPSDNIEALQSKLEKVGMEKVYSSQDGDWSRDFWFSSTPDLLEIPWAKDFGVELASLPEPRNQAHFATYLWTTEGGACFALSFGKAHFYLREFCDSDFGLDMAKRIGDRDDVRQKAARRYAGRSRKEIRSYRRESSLDIESGESVDYLHASTTDPASWGTLAKFGASLLLSLPIERQDLPKLLDDIVRELQQPELFSLPRTEVVKDEGLVAAYDEELLNALLAESADFEESSHQLVGVDFVFSGHEQYYFQRYRAKSPILTALSMTSLRGFIVENRLTAEQVFDVKVVVLREDSKVHSQPLKKSLEYSIENDKIFLRRGEWVRFNEEYAAYLDDYIDASIEVDRNIEPDLTRIEITEPAFNENLQGRGYEVADKDFSILQVRKYRVEAWDLKKGKTVYAVKFGTSQELGYVCDQAINVLEIYRNEPAAFKDIDIDTYCLWLGFARANVPQRLSDVNSIIFKQKLEAWARKCQTMNIKPMVRISQKLAQRTGG